MHDQQAVAARFLGELEHGQMLGLDVGAAAPFGRLVQVGLVLRLDLAVLWLCPWS